MTYENYIFDLYGTLIDIRTDEWSKMVWKQYVAWLKTENISYWRWSLQRTYSRKVKEAADVPSYYHYPEFDILPVFAEICRKKRPDYTDEQVWHAGEMFRKISTSMIRLYPNTLKVLDELKKNGKKIFLLSNAQRVFTWQELEQLGLLSYFDGIYISSDAGCKKPDSEFFQKLLRDHKLHVSDCLMVGNDSTSDIAGATALGMDACYIRTAISPENDPTPDCKYVFEDGDIGHLLNTI